MKRLTIKKRELLSKQTGKDTASMDNVVVGSDGWSEVRSSEAYRMLKNQNVICKIPNIRRERLINEANKYLSWQEDRIIVAIISGNIMKATLIWFCLLQMSKAYHIALLNKAIPGWYYKYDQVAIRQKLFKAINKCKEWNLKLVLKRFYILKADGKRFRPIGAPTVDSKIISKAVNDMVYYLTLKNRMDFQHGYMKGRGVHTAILKVLEYLKAGYRGFEFDLRSFFNQIKWGDIFKAVGMSSPPLAYLVSGIVSKIRYEFDEIKEESELKVKKYTGRGRRAIPVIERSGVPQGLSFSPLLATLALETIATPAHIVMYADDGIAFAEGLKKNTISKWMDRLYFIGARLAPEKCGVLGEQFNFLGVKFDRVEQSLTYKESKISWWESEGKLYEWAKTVANKYGKTPKNWTWEIRKNSYIKYLNHNLKWMKWCKVIWYGIMYQKSYGGYKLIWWHGIVDVMGSSSRCSSQLLRDIVLYKNHLRKNKGLTILDMSAFKPYSYKTKYLEKVEHIWPPNYRPWTA